MFSIFLICSLKILPEIVMQSRDSHILWHQSVVKTNTQSPSIVSGQSCLLHQVSDKKPQVCGQSCNVRLGK